MSGFFSFSLPGDVTGQAVEIDPADWIMFDLVPCGLEQKWWITWVRS